MLAVKSLLSLVITSSVAIFASCMRVSSFESPAEMSQKTLGPNTVLDQWQIFLNNNWDVLGPFPIHAREQHFILPGFPLNLTSPYQHEETRTWPSSLAENAEVTWKKVPALGGNLAVSFPDVRWSKIRATEGWAGLQHHAILHTSLTVMPPRVGRPDIQAPRVHVQLTHSSFFTILPRESPGYHPEWHPGNIYDMHRAPANTVALPGKVNLDKATTFDFFIRLFNDPRDTGQETPTLRINVAVIAEEKQKIVVREQAHDVVCDFVDGFAFGDALGIGIRSVEGWWTVNDIELPEQIPSNITLSILDRQVIAPSQTRVVPILIKQTGKYDGRTLSFNITLSENPKQNDASEPASVSIPVTLSLRQLRLWNRLAFESIRATFFFASSHPTYFLAKPPKATRSDASPIPILALHGAGVDIITQPFWANAIPRQEYSWVVIPFGRTEWGLDWHGPSASEAWATLTALSSILSNNEYWRSWHFASESRAVIIGHSNGGQGAWYLASRFPDRTYAVVAAAGFLNAAAYVPLTLSRGARFTDPALRSVLESSFTPDDNALFLGNLADTVPVLAVHGGNDTNVPTWHSREYVSITKSLGHGLNVTFHEDEGQPHWYPNVFESEQVRSFLQGALDSKIQEQHRSSEPVEFTLTVADPVRSGSKNGWRIEELVVPGRLARLHVKTRDGITVVRTVNVRSFSLAHSVHTDHGTMVIDRTRLARSVQERRFSLAAAETWIEREAAPSSRPMPPGRVQNIFDTTAPLTIIISSDARVYPKMLSAALRIAQALDVYLKLDSEIILDTDAVQVVESTNRKGLAGHCLRGNLVILGGAENALSRKLLTNPATGLQTEFGLSEDGTWVFRGETLDKGYDDLGILFTHPHPTNPAVSAVFLSGTSLLTDPGSQGFERVLGLLVPRTGIAVPDWIIVRKDIDQLGTGGVIGAGVWDSTWRWNEAMSYTH
ncbi:hypothetical protein ACEPAF_4707 [Sanghuangporus sanghuang]